MASVSDLFPGISSMEIRVSGLLKSEFSNGMTMDDMGMGLEKGDSSWTFLMASTGMKHKGMKHWELK